MKKILLVLCGMVCSAHLMGNTINWTSPPTSLSTTSVDSSNASISMDTNGDVAAIWLENGVVKARTKNVGAGWGSVATLSGSSASSPGIVSDGSGNATAVWLEGSVVKASTKPFGSSWGSTVTLSSTGSSMPTIAVDAAGDVIAAWARSGNIQTATRLFGANWSNAVNITSSSATAPAIAMGGTGSGSKAVLAWNALSGGIPVIYLATKTVSGNWGTPQIISDTTHSATNPSAAVDLNGNAIVAWFRYDLLGVNYFNVAVQSSYMISGGSWGALTTLSEEGYRNPASLMIKLAFDGGGNAVALWNNSFDGATYDVQAAMKPVRSEWSVPVDLVVQNPYAYQFGLSGTAFGEAVATLMFYNGNALMVQSTESDFSGFMDNVWTPPLNISVGTNNGYSSVAASIASNVMNAGAIWIKNNGSRNIVYAATGSKNMLLPPTSLSASQSSSNLGIFTEYHNTVGWTASGSSDVAGYLIYRNGMFLAEVDANATQYVDVNRVQSQATTYGVATVDTWGSVSKIATVNYP